MVTLGISDTDLTFQNTIQSRYTSYEDGGSPDARLRLARLRLNDGAKLWVSFKVCFASKQIIFITHIGDKHYILHVASTLVLDLLNFLQL